MKDRLILFSVVICIFTVISLFHPAITPAAPRPQVIKIVMDNNYPPYVFLDRDGKLQGILIDQWKLWEQKVGIRTEISAMEWGEALRRMKAGEFDVIDTIFKTEERSRWLDFTRVYDRLEVSAFFDKEISGISDAASLKGFVVAAKTGDAAVDVLKKHGVDSLLLFNSYEAIILAAKEHKITVFVMDNPPAHYYLHKFGIHDRYKQSPPLYSGELHRAVKKGNSELLKVIEDGFGLISSEELKIIESTWYSSPPVDRNFLRYFYIIAGSLCLLVLALFAWNRTLKKNVEKRTAELKTSEEHVSLILNSIAEGIYGVDIQGSCTFCNPAALRLLGYERSADVVGKKIHPLIHHTRPDGTHYHSKDCRIYCSYREGKDMHADDEVFWRSDGTSFPVEYWAQPVMRNGVPMGAVTAFVDITERRRIENALQESYQLMESMFEQTHVLIAYLDPRLNFVRVNRAYALADQREPAFFTGKNHFDLYPNTENETIFRQVVESGVPHFSYAKPFEYAEHPERDVSYWDWSLMPIKDSNSQVHGLIVTLLNVTDRIKSEEVLLDQEQELSAIFDNAPYLMILLDEELRVVRGNNTAFAHTGASVAKEIGTRLGEALRCLNALNEPAGCGFGPRCKVCVIRDMVMDTLKTGQNHYQREARMQVSAGGHDMELNLLISTARLTIRKQSMVLVSMNDITENKRLEAQLRQSQKIESIGTLAGGVAHDFNNILTAITGYGHLTLMKMAQNDPLRPNIQQILESADRAAHLTKDLLLFSRKQPIDRKPIDLNEGIHKLAKFLVRVIGEDITFKTTLSGGSIRVLADSHQLDQVLMNLAANARDAMPKGGIFTITTEQVWLNEEFTSSHGLGMPGKYAVISASDTGEGMNEETRQRVFEPFFTTKEVGKGTGLGLSVVYGIVKQHDGCVNVYSEPGNGTTFRIYLPVNETSTSAEPVAPAEEPPVGGTETILLAEDDKTVREMTFQLLQDCGYTVITAVDGEDAVKKFSENKDRVQLLLFDLIMPGKSGKDAYDEIRLVRPDIKVIFASGYDPDMVRQKALLEQHVPVVYKPVPMAALLKKIRSVLDEGKV